MLAVFLYIRNEQLELKIHHLHQHQKKKYLGINLTKYIQDLCEEKLQNVDEKSKI